MATRMMHPVHGFTHAYNNNDIAYLEKLGWGVEPNAETVAAMAEADEILVIRGSGNVFRDLDLDNADEKHAKALSMIEGEIKEEADIRKAYFDKFGKKPHHMMKLENIRKAIDDSE